MTSARRFALALVCLWLGAMLMLSTVAPAVFGVVGQEQAGQIMRRIFPAYYALSLVVPLLAMAIIFPSARRDGQGMASLFILGLSVAAAAWNAFVLSPRLAAMRAQMHAGEGAGGSSGAEAFGNLHVQSVGLLVLLMLLALVYAWIEILARPGADSPP